MEVQPDFRDLFELFNKHKVKYVIVGGYALAFHGAPRYTGDMDIFVKPDKANAVKILTALNEFGFGSVGLETADFEKTHNVIQLGVAPVRVDLITSLTGLTWDDAFYGCEKEKYGDVPVVFISRKQFILNKRATGRKQDAADLEALGEE